MKNPYRNLLFGYILFYYYFIYMYEPLKLFIGLECSIYNHWFSFTQPKIYSETLVDVSTIAVVFFRTVYFLTSVGHLRDFPPLSRIVAKRGSFTSGKPNEQERHH